MLLGKWWSRKEHSITNNPNLFLLSCVTFLLLCFLTLFQVFAQQTNMHTHINKDKRAHAQAHTDFTACSCHLIYDKGQIAICLKAFYDGADLVMVAHHLFSARGVCPWVSVCLCVKHGFMQQHYNRASILQVLFMHWPLSEKPALYAWFIILRERQKRWEERKRSL